VSVSREENQPFYFLVVFWGSEYRGYFTDICLASLLANGNIPSLDPGRKNRFIICTTRVDWDELQGHALISLLKNYIEIEWVEMTFPEPGDLKMLVMSKGHRSLSARAFEDRAYGVFLTPDLMLSDGSVAALQRLASAGKQVVLVVAIRFGYEKLQPALQMAGYMKQGQPMTVTPRELMRLALPSLHSETLRYEFDKPYFASSPISVYWQVPRGNGIIIYSFSWAPLLVNYGGLDAHCTDTFDKWTLDGDYVYRNFCEFRDIHVVADSDEISLVSFTKESELHYEFSYEYRNMNRWIAKFRKIQMVRTLRDSSVMDPLKRQIFSTPVYLHSREITPVWKRTVSRTNRVIEQVDVIHPVLERMAAVTVRFNRILAVIRKGSIRPHLATWLDIRTKRFWPFLKPVLEQFGVHEKVRRRAIFVIEWVRVGRQSRYRSSSLEK
jgi:hypothetical protein